MTGNVMDDGSTGGDAGWTTRTATGGCAPTAVGRSSSRTRPVKTRPTAFAMSAARCGERSVTETSIRTESSALDAVICSARSTGDSGSRRSRTTCSITRGLVTSLTYDVTRSCESCAPWNALWGVSAVWAETYIVRSAVYSWGRRYQVAPAATSPTMIAVRTTTQRSRTILRKSPKVTRALPGRRRRVFQPMSSSTTPDRVTRQSRSDKRDGAPRHGVHLVTVSSVSSG